VANSNRRNNTGDSLIVNGSLSSDSTEIKEYIVYMQMFSEQYSWRPGLSFQAIGEEEGSWLERDFEESEVFEVVKNLNGDKPLDLMVFLWVFFKHVGKF